MTYQNGIKIVNPAADFFEVSKHNPRIWDIVKPQNNILTLRPRFSENSLIGKDLSKSNAQLIKIGVPGFSGRGGFFNSANAFETDVQEPLNMTLMVTSRLRRLSNPWPVVGEEVPICGTWNNGAGSAEDYGFQLSYRIVSVNETTAVIQPWLRAFLAADASIAVSFAITSISVPVSETATPFQMFAVRFDASSEKYIRQILGANAAKVEITVAAGGVSARRRANPVTSELSKLQLGKTRVIYNNTLYGETMEMIVWDSVLTDTEITEQYNLSKAAFTAIGEVIE